MPDEQPGHLEDALNSQPINRVEDTIQPLLENRKVLRIPSSRKTRVLPGAGLAVKGYRAAKKQLSRQSMLYSRYDPRLLKVPIPDTASFLAGVYQGYMNAAGMPMPLDNVSTTAAVLGGSEILNYLSARFKSPHYNGKRANPDWVGVKQAARGTVVNGLEMTVGYAIGQTAYRVLN